MILPIKQHGGRDEMSELQILVVDDSYLPRHLIASSLLCHGYSIVTAEDGLDALSIIERCDVDGVVTDLHMPRASGDKLVSELRSSNSTRELPIIVISSDSDSSTQQHLIDIGASAFLPKPVDIAQLLAATREYVGDASQVN